MALLTYIGREKGVGNCFCCNSEIDSKHFECGHVIPISKGGPNKFYYNKICSAFLFSKMT
jgi:hypothetical protein